MNELLKKEIANWSYEQSIEKYKPFFYKWKNMTAELIRELYIARECLSNSGARTDLIKNLSRLTFKQYCSELGITYNTAYNWLQLYLPEENKLLTKEEYEQQKQIEQEELKQERLKKENIINEYILTGKKPLEFNNLMENL